jgi:glycosyltransferase involved in cell wall biosynthesis
MNRKPRVVYWNQEAAPYVVERFNHIVRRGALDFEVWFSRSRSEERSWEVEPSEWEFRSRVIPERRFSSAALQVPVPELLEFKPDLWISGYSSTSWVLGILAAKSFGTRVTFRLLPSFRSWFAYKRTRELLKHFLFRAADGAKISGSQAAAMARQYGMPDDRMIQVTQSIDVAHYRKAIAVAPAEREAIRRRLGLDGCVFIYVGRIWHGKGLDHLFEAYRLVRARRPRVSLMLVGDGKDEEIYRAMSGNLEGVSFVGFVQARDLPQYYASADVMVFPTLGDPYGLVVEEAMAAGLPVISSDAAGEIRERLPDGEAGYIVPAANAEILADRMLRLASDADLRIRLAVNAARLAQNRDHERYTSDFEHFVEKILSMPPRNTATAMLSRGIGAMVIALARKNPASVPRLPRSTADSIG